ncbi:hypothetical protein DEA8626_02271 [Defluviimonas aquaemixtae]|uniref:YjiS-like domain-containing protein n=1 Tax=Albidovulum aquaemixtae TaxID=1542388 RepID=A0A2R8B851_9RHOB|nr:DUF1127 domain-containing protein [Defluviimonas aquaemixtae]SPH18729.1 hypothetical protein DEA8626_02271 [Defluviimonas aquaemixtae]
MKVTKMAHMNDTRGIEAGLVDRIATLLSNLRDSRQRYKLYRQTRNELTRLSDRELHDLGISRSSINSIAIEAAYGK